MRAAWRRAGLLGGALFVLTVAAERTWERGPESLSLLQDGKPIWGFHFGREAGKPYFAPLGPVGGPDLTWVRPDDHPWHYGLWFSWKYINQMNYWEENPQTGKAKGETRWQAPAFETRDDGSAVLRMKLAYGPPGGDDLLTEVREVTLAAPDAQGAYQMDWTSTFTARQEVILDRTPLPGEPNGKSYGGYAGLSLRLARGMEAREVLLSGDPPTWEGNTFRTRARALAYQGSVGGQPGGMAFLPHPANLNSPSPWYAIRGPVMSFCSPAVLCFGSHTLKRGETLTLRYRIMIYPGTWTQDHLDRAAGTPWP